MKKILTTALVSLLSLTAAAQSSDLDDAIKQLEVSQKKEEETESEKAKKYLAQTINTAENKSERIAVIVMTYVTFEHKFLQGYPNYCHEYVSDFSRFKGIFQQANQETRKKVSEILSKNSTLAQVIKESVNSQKIADTERKAIDSEFQQVAISGYTYADMCDTFNSKSADDYDISFKKMYPEFAVELLSFDTSIPIRMQ